MAGPFASMDVGALDERYGKLRLMRPDVLATVRRSVQRHGVLQPLVVNTVGGGEANAEPVAVLLDGFKRLSVARELGHEQVPVRVVELSETAAQAAMLTYNATHGGGLAELEQAWLVRSLVRGSKLRQKEVAALLGRHKSWVCRRLMLAEHLAEGVEADMRLGLLGASVARELVRLPRGNQERVAQVSREHGLTCRQVAELVDRYLLADTAAGIDELLADPLRFCDGSRPEDPHAATRTAVDPRLSADGARIQRQFQQFERSAAGLCRVLPDATGLALADDDVGVLAGHTAAVLAAGERAVARPRRLRAKVALRGGCDA